MAMENNRSLSMERLSPEIQKTAEAQELAAFDPVGQAQISTGKSDEQTVSSSGIGTSTSDTREAAISLKQFFPGGTSVEIGISGDMQDDSGYEDPFYTTRLGLSVTQSLLRGYGADVNLAKIRQAQIDSSISEYELRAFVESLIAQVETACWEYALSRRQIEIVEKSMKIARQQMAETEEMIRVGTMAEAELVAVQAEVAAQQQGLINAKSTLESRRIELLRLLNPPGNNVWRRDVIFIHPATLPQIELDAVEDHVAVAKRMRPEINQAKLGIQRDDLELVYTKNGLLPRMDFFITLGKTGYADSFSGSADDVTGDGYDARAGLSLEYPFFNRNAGARHRRALLSKDQSEKALENLRQLVETEVRKAYVEVRRTKEQISASTATRNFQEEKLRIETEKFRVGRSTNFFVSQAQRDLLVSRIGEVEALVNYLKALIEFYRLEGSLVERRGIAAPGRIPIE